ncbi:hypothetical protein NCS56_01537600 [Fusarium sp. Ph1]|nr:hypothetical protein NCS56_01537600 [Fusarium sp. Ph1]
MGPSQWQELFSSHTPRRFEDKPKQTCPHTEHSQQTPAVSFDIDSILGFATSPGTAVHRIRFYSAPQYSQNISTDVHLTLDRVDLDPERPRLVPSRLKDVPHFIFARAEGADFITFHLFFPHFPRSRDFNRLTDEQLSRWFDDIFYPAVRQVYDVDRLQHLPASYRHALATCRAPQVEGRLLETLNYQAQLRMPYFLPREGLQQLWDHVLAALRRPGLQDFRDPELFVEAKGTKLLFKYLYAPSDHLDRLYDGNIPKTGQNFYYESMLRDAGGMTTLTPPSSQLRHRGILHGQMYSLAKGIIDAARTFLF